MQTTNVTEITKTRIFSQLTREIPEARRKAEKCYESDGAIVEGGKTTKIHYYNHFVTVFYGGEATACQCGAISAEEATRYFVTKTLGQVFKLKEDLMALGALRA